MMFLIKAFSFNGGSYLEKVNRQTPCAMLMLMPMLMS